MFYITCIFAAPPLREVAINKGCYAVQQAGGITQITVTNTAGINLAAIQAGEQCTISNSTDPNVANGNYAIAVPVQNNMVIMSV